MARRRRRSGERDDNSIATDTVLPSLSSFLSSPLPETVLEVEDRRLWHPEPDLVQGLSKLAPTVVAKPAKARPGGRTGPSPDVFKFAVPEKVAVCVRRKQRREVIFAKGRAGKGAKARYRRRNDRSNVSCR